MSAGVPRVISLIAVCGLIAVVAFILLAWSDPYGAYVYGGPFAGRVVNAETKKPIPHALVAAGWGGSIAIHGVGCVGHALTQTDTTGRFRIGWQGLSMHWFLHDKIAPGSLTVWAPGYRAWTITVDGPRQADGTSAALPSGSPFETAEIGDIGLTPAPGMQVADDDTQHIGSCESDDRFEVLRLYRADRFRWEALCGTAPRSAAATTDGWLALAEAWKRFGVPSLKPTPTVLAKLKEASANYDAIDLMVHDKGRLKSGSELTENDRQRICAMLDIRLPEYEE